MLLVQRSVFGNRFIQIAAGEIVVPEHAVADRFVWKIAFDLFQKLFDLRLLPLCHVHTYQCGTRIGILWISFHRMPELLFRFRKAASRLVVTAKGELSAYRLGIQADSFLEICFRSIGLVSANL